MNNGLLGFPPGRRGTVTFWDRNKPPAMSSPYDDEFEGTSLDPKWVWQNQGTASATVAEGHLALISANNFGVSNSQRQLLQTAPAGPWTIVTHLKHLGWVSFHDSGLYLRASGGAGVNFGIITDSSSFVQKLIVRRMTGDTTESGSTVLGVAPQGDIYLRIRNDATNLFYDFSFDGRVWSQARTETIASGISNIARFGFAVDSIGTQPHTAAFEFFRYTSTASTAATGGSRTITGS